MKTLGRIMIILTVFAIVMGITYVAVSAGSSSTSANPPAVGRSGERPDFGGAEPHGGGWGFGLIKIVGILAIIITIIVVPKSFLRRRTVPVRVK